MKTALARLAFPVSTHQNANEKPIESAPAYWAQCTLPPQPFTRLIFLIFSGSSSETMHTDIGASLCSGALANTFLFVNWSTGHGTTTTGNALHLKSQLMNYDLFLVSTCRQPPINELQDNDFSWT